ncbi:MAG TPA: M28 family peptidase [Planctomycetaceae bacterium]|nr:M28 family peptidase [Planctomycetaceae bacterium]
MRFTRLAARWILLSASGLSLILAATVRVPADTRVESQSHLLKDIKYLASDELEGRGIGTDGLNKAADYIRDQFKEAGLDVTRVKGGAFQFFKMTTKAILGSPNSVKFVGPDGKVIELKQDVDFVPCSFGGGGKFSGDVVFAGYGLDDAQPEYRDFKGIDVKGKVVIVMRRNPRQEEDTDASANGPGPGRRPGRRGAGRFGDLRSKLSNAIAAGASAILFVNDPFSVRKAAKDSESRLRRANNHVIEAAEALDAAEAKAATDAKAQAAAGAGKTGPTPPAVAEALKDLREEVTKLKKAKAEVKKPENDAFMKFGYGGTGSDNSIPVVQLSIEAADRLLKPTLGKTLNELESAIDQDMKPQSALVKGWKVDGLTTIDRSPTEVKNVIGVLEGEGPHADETVVVGAHYDHLGRGGLGSLTPGSKEIHNGADDNASGTVSVLELARRFGQRGKKLPRRLVFMTFTGEEEGLVGSAHYCKEPVFPLDHTIAMINLDMVGRLKDDKLTVYGTGTSDRWIKLLKKFAPPHQLQLILKPEGFGPSDQSSFYAKKIPVLHFFTGTHPDYHRPTDDWEKINVEGMNRIVDLIEQVVADTDEEPSRPPYIEIKEQARVERQGSRPYFGSIPDFASEAKGYAITGVAPGSPAEKGGLKGGDIIIEFAGRKITGLDDFDLALRRVSAGDEVAITALRAGKPVKLKVTMGTPK